MNPNRTMSRSDFDRHAPLQQTAMALWKEMRAMHAQDLAYSNWWGALDPAHQAETQLNLGPDYVSLPGAYDDINIPWYPTWERCWLLWHLGLLEKGKTPCRILDLGGAASVLDIVLAKHGHSVVVVDRRPKPLEVARYNAQVLNLSLKTIQGNLATLAKLLEDEPVFDYVVSVNVLFLCGEEARQHVCKELHNFVRSGGQLGFTFDFLNPRPDRYLVDPVEHFPFTGFKVWPAGASFEDNNERYAVYYPDPKQPRYTMGALFMERDG